jgi:predicted nucleic-acid-binding Zn-ribbon protein
MPSDRHECPKCGRQMQPGYFLDSKHGERRGATEWVEGVPVRSFWMGLKIKGRQVLPVTVYRCERCGFLESYAAPRL